MFNLEKDIIKQIQDESYEEYGEKISQIKDFLGSTYTYEDLLAEMKSKAQYESALAYKAIVQLQQELIKMKRENLIYKEYLRLIYELGYDCDGYSDILGLKNLVEELCYYAKIGTDANTSERIYSNKEKDFNILFEEIEK